MPAFFREVPMSNKLWLIPLSLCLQASAALGLTVDEVVSRNIQARGGLQNIKALRSLRLTGKVQMGSGRGDGLVEAAWGQVQKRPAQFRQETTRQGLTAVDAYDGREGWSMQPFGGRRDPTRLSADDAKAFAQNSDIEGPLVDWREK